MMVELDELEGRIQAAVALLAQLREEKRRLELENDELKNRVRALETAAGKQADDMKPRLKVLEEERTTLLDERRAVARRVEEMLAKLAVLEKAVHV